MSCAWYLDEDGEGLAGGCDFDLVLDDVELGEGQLVYFGDYHHVDFLLGGVQGSVAQQAASYSGKHH